jgi:hypothetical protein
MESVDVTGRCWSSRQQQATVGEEWGLDKQRRHHTTPVVSHRTISTLSPHFSHHTSHHASCPAAAAVMCVRGAVKLLAAIIESYPDQVRAMTRAARWGPICWQV